MWDLVYHSPLIVSIQDAEDVGQTVKLDLEARTDGKYAIAARGNHVRLYGLLWMQPHERGDGGAISRVLHAEFPGILRAIGESLDPCVLLCGGRLTLDHASRQLLAFDMSAEFGAGPKEVVKRCLEMSGYDCHLDTMYWERPYIPPGAPPHVRAWYEDQGLPLRR